MKSKRGFTLIELLVVMAIIAILAAIVVPNVARWIDRARMTRAQSEIESIELSLTKMLTDTSRSTVNQLFKPDAVWAYAVNGATGFNIIPNTNPSIPPTYEPLPTGVVAMNAEQFRRVQELYTRVLYALLRDGREAITSSATDDALQGLPYRIFVDSNVAKNIGTSYLGDLALDPWGQLYQIFPGPWPRNNDGANPIIFRTLARSEAESNLPGVSDQAQSDFFSVSNPEDPAETIGYPAPRDKVAFIYSTGQNITSGQMLYRNPFEGGYVNTTQFPQDYSNYVSNPDQRVGGGDDINNWDSGASWTRFYN